MTCNLSDQIHQSLSESINRSCPERRSSDAHIALAFALARITEDVISDLVSHSTVLGPEWIDTMRSNREHLIELAEQMERHDHYRDRYDR